MKFLSNSSSGNFAHETIFLIDELRHAKIKSPNRNFVNVQNVSIRLDNRSAIFQHPTSRIEFRSCLLGKNPKLHFACGIRQNVWTKLNHSIIFEIFAKTVFHKPVRIFFKELSSNDLAEHGWVDIELDLNQYTHKKVKLIFATSVPSGENTEYCWSVWGDPEIKYEGEPLKKYTNKIKPAHIFFITSDALRQDYLGTYGNRIVKTPACDSLAEDGVLFNQARVQTVSTLGSYASMFLSQTPLTHTITAEWGAIPKGLVSLPEYLSSNGYKTLLVPSELELIDPKAGLINLFNEHIPCYGNPSQDGRITTRLAIEKIERQTKPTFFWIQYFDTHPPVTPPEPYRSMYYSGDPTATVNRYRPEAVRRIKGVEAMQEFDISVPLLKKNQVDEFILAKLDATQASFRGANFSDPDLAIHLKNLGPKAYKNMTNLQFASWLKEQVIKLKSGLVQPELLNWLDEVLPMLQDINDDITIWLDKVIDFRYPLAQYCGAVSYLDSHIGKLLTYLKENNLYDQSLIILTSPHGEIFDEHDIYFHHHTLTESCLRVPLIIKPPKNLNIQTGKKLDGIFDSIDLFPTITDLLGLKPPQNIAGVSRASNVYANLAIAEHDSFALNNSHTMASVTRGNYKFIKVDKDHINSPKWHWHKGDKMLFDLNESPTDTNNLIHQFPDLATQMEKRLDAWLSS